MTNAQKIQATLVEQKNHTRIYIGNLQIEIKKGTGQFGPLRGNSGINLWREKLIVQDDETFQTSTGELITSAELDQNHVEEIRDHIRNR